MKEIPFRWIDKYLIHLKIQEKFYLLFFFPIAALVSVTLVLDRAADLMLAQFYRQELVLLKDLIEAGSLSAQQVSSIIAKSDTITLGNGVNAMPIMDGTLSLIANHNMDLWHALNFNHWLVIGVTLLVLAAGVYYIMTFIGGAMYSLHKALETLSQGDLTYRMNYFPVRDEFSEIAITFDKVAEREQKLVHSIQESVALMQQISSDLNLSAQSSSGASENQQEHLNSLASATEQMASTIREVASLAHNASQQTEEAKRVANTGQTKVTQTLTSVGQLANEISSASHAVTELDSNAAQIDAVVSTINAISEQTNLLALNAAIEAARAGEQGRGFAVVADEVRALAGRTQRATVEIQSMIEALQRNSQSLTKLMEVTVASANQGHQFMTDVSGEINALAQKNQSISDSSVQIATAAEEQGVVADNIAGSVEEIRQKASGIHKTIQSTTHTIKQLRQQSDQLERLLTGLQA